MIRACRISDIEFLVPMWSALDQHVVKRTGNSILNSKVENYDEVVSKDLHELIDGENATIFVAEVSDVLIGFVTAHIEILPWFIPVFGLIGRCWVNENCRRTGVGFNLVKYAENWLNDKDVHNIQVCWDKKNSEANSFWQKNGYSITQLRGTKSCGV